MICIYEANETDWHGNGLCVLQPFSCTVSEIAGGDFGLTLVHPITEDLRWKDLQEERIIKVPVPAYKPLEDDGTVIVPAEQATEQCFRIYSVSVDTANHEVTVEARHISYDFMGNMCGRLSIQVGTYVVNALTKMREALMSPDGRILATNIVRRVSLGDRSFVNPIKYLLDPELGLVQRSRARLVRDNADFYLLDNDDPPDRGYEIAYGKNMTGISWSKKTDSVITHIVPLGEDTEGNTLLLPEKWIDSPHINDYWIDFGMIGHVTDKDIDLIQDAVKALLIQDADSLVNAVMGMSAASEKTDRTMLTRDAEMFIQKYMNVKSVSDINVIEVFDEVMSLAAKNHVSMPGRFTMLARSLTTLEGVIEQLCPDLNIFDMLYDKLKERARQNMNIPRELFEKGQELVKAGKKAARIPLLASEVLEGMVKGKTKVRFELSGYEEPLNRIFHFLRYTVLTLVALVLFIGSCILCTTDFKPILPNGVPLLAVAGIVFSIALAIFSIKKLK